ncbi:uncharacterized protein [Lolium perenne]|uniref:uncharacterized protein isoform X2 n=1 Tax=Lolium perenne TaxID=4522 RepID=UPI0021F5DF70|nr:uncharacterized protein LOC127345592 isoform X2 [Lolium perenne]
MRKWWRCGGRGCVQPCPVGIAGSILVAIVQAAAGAGDGEGDGQADSAECSVNMDEKKMDWTKRYGKSRLNAEKTKCMQEIVCGCSGKPEDENTKFCRCECPPKLGLRRTSDSRWYIIEHRLKHNHTIMDNCGKKNNRRRLRKCKKCAVHKMVTSEHVWLAKMQADGERLRAMKNLMWSIVAPKTILTYQCRPVELAIGNVMPATTHRCFKW